MTTPVPGENGPARSRTRLELKGRAVDLTITSSGDLSELCSVRTDGPPPDVDVSAASVVVTFPHRRPFGPRPTRCELVLSAAPMWELRAARGIQDIRADLTGIDLEGISVAGLAGAEFLLPKPRGTVAVKVGGGATGVEISRPRGVAARVEVGGGVHGLTLDGNTFGAVGGRTEWATPDHDHARDRYVISFLRGASSVVVRQRERQEDTGAASIRRLATVLFTDIVGSTRLAADQGDRRWTQTLEQHDEVAARIVREHGGRVVKQTGDGMLALFDRPGSALASATVFRDESRRDGIEIRAGVHTGEVELRGEDVSGIAVHIAARIMDEAPDGEILASRTVRELVAGEDFGFEDRGVHALRGIDDEWALAAVSRRGD